MTAEKHQDGDAALADGARCGDHAALVELANRWWPAIFRFTWNMSGSTSLATDATERTLAAALRGSEPPSSSEPFAVFVYRTALHFTLRRDGTGRTSEKRADAVAALRDALQRLDPVDRAGVVLAEIAQLPMEQVSAVLSMPADETRKRIHRSLLALTDCMKSTLDSTSRAGGV
jgi:DNA-directed RNA polymerase specialized sigma24 family protein